jgi:hypothetical protein
LTIHHAPHEGKAISRKRENRCDQQAVDQQPQIEDRHACQNGKIAKHLFHRGRPHPSLRWAALSRCDRAAHRSKEETGRDLPASVFG